MRQVVDSRWQLYPVFRIALVMFAGLLVGGVVWRYVELWTLFAALVVALVAAVLSRGKVMMQSLFMLIATFVLGCMLISKAERGLVVEYVDYPIEYDAVLLSEPLERGKVVRCDLFIASGAYEGRKLKASILRDTVDNRYRRLHRGDGIRAVSVVERPVDYAHSSFSWSDYLHNHAFAGTTLIYWDGWVKQQVSLASMPVLQRVGLRVLELRDRVVAGMRGSGLSADALALLSAMSLGERSALSPDIRGVFASTGVSHVLALSGLHIGIIYMLLTFLLPFRRHRVGVQLLLLCGIWSYVLLVGMSPSVVRAATMLTVYSFVSLLRRRPQPLNTLALAAMVMFVAHPQCIYDVGFQLSFVSVLFIVLFFRPVYRLLPSRWTERSRLLRWIWSLVAMSATAQTGTAPLVIHHFGTFAPYFLVANLVVIPLATVLLCGAILLLLTSLLPMVQGLVALFLSMIVDWQMSFLKAVASLPGATATDLSLTSAQTWVLYVVIFALAGAVYFASRGRIGHVNMQNGVDEWLNN